MSFTVKVIRDKKPWTPNQTNKLVKRINTQMAAYGYVDFASIAYHCDHSMASCESKAHSMNLKFTKKQTPKPNLQAISTRKNDMYHMPLHKNGKKVDYRNRGDEYMNSWRN